MGVLSRCQEKHSLVLEQVRRNYLPVCIKFVSGFSRTKDIFG